MSKYYKCLLPIVLNVSVFLYPIPAKAIHYHPIELVVCHRLLTNVTVYIYPEEWHRGSSGVKNPSGSFVNIGSKYRIDLSPYVGQRKKFSPEGSCSDIIQFSMAIGAKISSDVYYQSNEGYVHVNSESYKDFGVTTYCDNGGTDCPTNQNKIIRCFMVISNYQRNPYIPGPPSVDCHLAPNLPGIR